MTRVLTGIQSSGKPHLGNILGAIIPAIKMSNNEKNESLFFCNLKGLRESASNHSSKGVRRFATAVNH